MGNVIHYPRPGRNWLTFHDFLIDYVQGCFGERWRAAESSKASNARHPAFSMFEGLAASRRARAGIGNGIVKKARWTGDIAGVLTLAYDLFTVADNATLQGRLIERLRHHDQYQGARYELFAIATCVRAGFTVEYEDETDGSKKHPELIATHKKTGLKVAVEAKSRHRRGVLAFSLPTATAVDERRAGVRGLLIDAARKDPMKPYVVFVDVNLPDHPVDDPNGPPWGHEVSEETLPALHLEHRRKLNMVVCTNITFHRAAEKPPSGTYFVSVHQCVDPAFPFDRAVLDTLAEATKVFQNVPHECPGEPLVVDAELEP